MNRRTILAGSLATTAAATMAQASTKSAASPRNFVLVHGAWHGGWCWRDVRAVLERQGHRVFTPTLTGLGERAHLRTPAPNLSTHIQDVVSVIEAEELTDVILCGHSYGGMVVTGVADRLKGRLRHIVYLDAALPKDGQNMFTQNPASPSRDSPALKAQIAALAPGGQWMPVFPAEFLGVPTSKPSLNAWVSRRLTPHPLASWTETIALKNGGSDGLARTYVLCTDPLLPNTAFPAHAAKAKADPTWRYAEIATGHDAMVTEPEAVAKILTNAA